MEKAIQLFSVWFFYSYPDWRQALSLCEKAIEEFRDLSADQQNNIQIVRIAMEIRRKNKPNLPYSKGVDAWFRSPINLDLSGWWSFQWKTPEFLVSPLLWRMLGLPRSEVAAGMGLTESTLVLRENKALQELGAVLRKNVGVIREQ
ncbi:MAG: hypothetical protein N2578_01390 [Bdellovibrionaceae bacterium]|nr:hypothetical protein [Pseudobdellovibrionaceae bacterium]